MTDNEILLASSEGRLLTRSELHPSDLVTVKVNPSEIHGMFVTTIPEYAMDVLRSRTDFSVKVA